MNVPSFRRAHGFSLVELIISVVISLLALMFATRLYVESVKNKESSIGASDSMQSGMQALFTINRDVAQAGWGVNDPMIAGCDTIFTDTDKYELTTTTRSDSVTPIAPMAAVIITENGTKPDTLTLLAGSSMTGTGSVGLSKNYAGGSVLSVDRIAFGFRSGDAILVVPENGNGLAPKCALAQLAAAPTIVDGIQEFSIAAGGTNRFNRSDGLKENYASSVSRVFNLGPANNLSFHTWSVDSGFLRLRATNLTGASEAPLSVVDNIVSLKAQYGFDTNALFDPQQGLQVKQWSASMVDADSSGVTGDRGDYERIGALRVAVVARARTPEKPDASGRCSATKETIKVFGEEAPKDVDPVEIEIDVDVAGDTIDWQCYRYRVFETIVPMRNLAWRPTAG